MRKTSTSQLMEDDPKNVRDTIRKKILTLPEILKEAIYEVREIKKIDEREYLKCTRY